MRIDGDRVVLESIPPELAARILARDERAGDDWHPEYPFADELAPLRSLARASDPDPVFTMYLIRRRADGLAVGGIGFFGPPDADGRVELGYGLIASARGAGLATEALRTAVGQAARSGARLAAADTDLDNVASQRVLAKAGFAETARDATKAYFERTLHGR